MRDFDFMSLKLATVLAADLLATTLPSPAPVTVLPEEKPKTKPAASFVGTWRGTTLYRCAMAPKPIAAEKFSPTEQEVEVKVTSDLKVSVTSIKNGSMSLGDPWKFDGSTLRLERPGNSFKVKGDELRSDSMWTLKLSGGAMSYREQQVYKKNGSLHQEIEFIGTLHRVR